MTHQEVVGGIPAVVLLMPTKRFVEGFVDNFLDEDLVYGGFEVASSGLIARIWQPPRRAGARVAFDF